MNTAIESESILALLFKHVLDTYYLICINELSFWKIKANLGNPSFTLDIVPIMPEKYLMDDYLQNAFCKEVFASVKEYYGKVGIRRPWLCYFFLKDKHVVATGGFKGPPKNDRVEIAYGTLPQYEGQGFASTVCHLLVQIALKASPYLLVTARTLMEENASTRILKKNGFSFFGPVSDPEDGQVWEWHWSSPK